MNLVVGAFGKFESTSSNPQEVTPQLGINLYELRKFFGTGFCVCFKVVNLASTIIDESHGDVNVGGAVRRYKSCSMSLLFMVMEKGTARQDPYDW